TTNPYTGNRYAYGAGNPTSMIEADGHTSCDITGMCGGTYRETPTIKHEEADSPEGSTGSTSSCAVVVLECGSDTNSSKMFLAPPAAPLRVLTPASLEAPPVEGGAPEGGPRGGGELGAIVAILSQALAGDTPQDHEWNLDNDRESENCLKDTSSTSTIFYNNPDDKGRATGAWACLSATIRKVNFTDPQQPVGWKSGMDRAHLIAREFGGTHERKNIIPTSRTANREGMRRIERIIERRLAKNERVFYSAVPSYNVRSIRPTGVNMFVETSGGYNTSTFVPSGVYP
ncbi:DNA/RNA non-specific endonuclease, partial [Streptomyces sp. NRRL F-5126]|uniref:DNA/RNA non-specific endonuclease n=1 Tax=Streptomyces sp. NRRL F-5126 TaxID=1463857 RepID=UPI0018FE4C3F